MVTRHARTMLLASCSVFIAFLAAAQSGPPPTPEPPTDVSTIGVIGGPSEPGERLIIRGRVFAPDGVTPAAGVIIYAYQTDNTGQYRNDSGHMARLHGWAKADAMGRFEFRTIRPGPYPGGSVPAHIHFHAWGGGYPLQWTPELKFADDRLLSVRDIEESKALGDFGNVRAVERDASGVWHCDIQFRLGQESNYPAQYRDDPRTR